MDEYNRIHGLVEPSGERTPIWLDCDPGHDDAFAIILAAEHPLFRIIGISTVHGNASTDKVTKNVMSILTAMGRTEIPVYAGSSKPFMRPSIHAPDIHGESGIDGTKLLPEPAHEHRPGNAIKAMYDAVMATPPRTCVIATAGTLTNVALLFATFPDVADHINQVTIMGGSFTEGNITEHAEFNIYADPESANSVFSNVKLSNRITLIPLDLTHQVLATSSILESLLHPEDIILDGASGVDGHGTTAFRQMLYELLTFFAAAYASKFNITEGPPLHDPLAVAAVLPGLEWQWEFVKVIVDTHGVEIGRTQKHPPRQGETVVRVGVRVAVDKFWQVLLEMVGKADQRGRVQWS